jgi:hypothetical protein
MIYSLLAVPIAAFIWAKLEVEIEGKDGWAKNLPTWRIEKHILLDIFLNGRPLTGFHFWAFTFVLFIFHFPLFWVPRWTWAAESFVIGSILLFWVLEDFFWFMVNPYYGWKRYRSQEIRWHEHWFLGLPADHWGLLLISIALLSWSYTKI